MSQKSCCVHEFPITAENGAIYKQEEPITDKDVININISMNRKNADCSNSTHNYLNDEYSELTKDKTYDDDQKVYIEIETEMDLSHFEDNQNYIKREKENSDVVEQVGEDYGTHESSVGNNLKIKNIHPKVTIKRSKKSEEITKENSKITNEDLQIKIEIDVNDEDKEKIVKNEAAARVDLSIVKQEVDNGFHMQVQEEQNKVDDLEIKKEVEDCNEVSNLKSDFEADNDTNIGAIIAETETRVEPKRKDDIQGDFDSNVLNRNLGTITKMNTSRSKKRKKCHRKASRDTYNCTKCLCIFESFDRYVSHFFLHDIKPNACPLCETSYESVKPLCNHIRNVHIAKSFVSLRLLNHEFDKMKTYKCLVCEDIVTKQHCFNHWEKHFRFEASKQRLGLNLLDLTDVDRKLENTFSAKVTKKFKAAIYKQEEAITDNNETDINISMNRKNVYCSNSTHNYSNEIVENEAGVNVDLSIVKQKVDNEFHTEIKEEQNKVDDLEIKKEVDDCNEVSKLECDFEADDTNNGAVIAETETRVEPKPKDDIKCAVDSNVLIRNLRTISRENTFRMEKRKTCHRFHSMMEKNTDDSHEERKIKRQIINVSSDDGKVEEERNRKNREKCKRYREKKKNEVAAMPISGSFDSDENKREEERKQKNREKIRRYREKKKNEIAALSISGSFDSDETKKEERKRKNRENVRRYREKKKNEVAADSISCPFDPDRKKREEERKQRNREKVRRYRERKKNKVAAVTIGGSSGFNEKKREEERKQKNRENVRRYREKKKIEVATVSLSISGPFDSEEKKREEERKQKIRENTRRYREKKKNEIEVAPLSMATANYSSDSSGTNTFSARVIKKFKGMNDTEKDAMIIDKGTCVNSDPQNSIEINVDNEKKSNAETLDLNRGVIEDINEDIEGKQHNSNGGDALRHNVDHEMKCDDSGEDTDAVVVVREEVRPDLHSNKDLYRNERIKGLVTAKEYYCTKCGVMLWSFHKYMEHLDQKHIRPPNSCPKCTQICINFKNFYEHVRRHIVNSFQQLNNEESEVVDEEMSKMVRCIECNLIVEKSRGFAHWEKHLRFDVNTIVADKELSKKETT